MTPDELLRAFGTAIDARQASLLVGAGLSRGAGFPLWEDLVDGAAVQVGVPKLDDFPLWAEYVEDAPDGAAILIDEVRRIASVEPMPDAKSPPDGETVDQRLLDHELRRDD